MKIVFLSTELTPHQIPLCNSLHKLADAFCFMQFSRHRDSWVSKGQTVQSVNYPYLRFYHEEKAVCDEMLLSADVVIVGGVDLSVIRQRLQERKLVFVYLERFYKNGISLKNIFRVLGGTYLHHGQFQKYRPFLLCASGYCAGDAAVFGNYRGRTLKWGYFPETHIADIQQLVASKREASIIWTGRFLDWKHPDDMLLVAKKLKERGYDFHLKLFGDGPMREDLQALINRYALGTCVALCGDVPNAVVRNEMADAAIFVSTSDYGEGWGCVVNEAMNNACAVVVSHAVGAAPFLIKNGENGFIYESGNVDELTDLCAKLLDSPQLCRNIGACAYETIVKEWNAQTAAERLLAVSQKILAKQDHPCAQTGPCSYAEPIKQKTMYTRIKNETCKQNRAGGDTAFSQ